MPYTHVLIMYTITQFPAGPPVIGFDQSNGNQFAIREGESIELCVVLESGKIPFEFTFDVDVPRTQGPPGSSSKYYTTVDTSLKLM